MIALIYKRTAIVTAHLQVSAFSSSCFSHSILLLFINFAVLLMISTKLVCVKYFSLLIGNQKIDQIKESIRIKTSFIRIIFASILKPFAKYNCFCCKICLWPKPSQIYLVMILNVAVQTPLIFVYLVMILNVSSGIHVCLDMKFSQVYACLVMKQNVCPLAYVF